jgi:hypothetical protein
MRMGFHSWKIRQIACFGEGIVKLLVMSRGAGIRSRSGSASVAQKRRISALATKKCFLML